MKLSNRLEVILSYIKPCEVLFDVGADHGLLSIEAARRNLAKEVYAIENAKGPYDRLVQNIAKSGLKKRVRAIYGSGLEIDDDRKKSVVIAGLGTDKIVDIVKKAYYLDSLDYLIVDSHTNLKTLREEVTKFNFYILDECVLQEAKIYYEIILFAKGNKRYDELDMTYGPINLKKRSDIFLKKLQERVDEIDHILVKIGDEDNKKSNALIKEKERILNIL